MAAESESDQEESLQADGLNGSLEDSMDVFWKEVKSSVFDVCPWCLMTVLMLCVLVD